MKNTKKITIIKAKTLLSLLVIVPMLVLTLSACKQESNQNALSVSDDILSAPIPSALLTATTDNLVVGVAVDGGPPLTCANLSVDQDNGTYACNLTLPLGFHTISLVYSINDTTRGLVQVASTTSTNIEITSGQEASANFGSATLTFNDTDLDGIQDLDELVNGTDPFDNSDPALKFTDTNQSLGSFLSRSVALGDLDGDGDLDLVVANGGEGNRIYTNDGAGILTDTNQSLRLNESNSVALGDIDGDGDLDMVVANINQGNRVYTNNGVGAFTDTNQSLGSFFSVSVALGDVDGDGDLDMVVANFGSADLIYINNGLGVFTDTGQSLIFDESSGGPSISLALGDVDGDGDLDIVVTDFSQSIFVYTNSGGVFTEAFSNFTVTFNNFVALGDLNGNGDLDLVLATTANNNPAIFTGTGTGQFFDTEQSFGTALSNSVALGDIDGDGDLDIVSVGNNDDNRIYTNDGARLFTDIGQSLGPGSFHSQSVALGDLDGDGDLDIVVGNGDDGNNLGEANSVYLND